MPLLAGKNMTPLQHAVFSGNLPIVRFLLDHGADLHEEDCLEGHDRFAALHTAAKKGFNTKQTSLIYSSFRTCVGFLFRTCVGFLFCLYCCLLSCCGRYKWNIEYCFQESVVESIHKQWPQTMASYSTES